MEDSPAEPACLRLLLIEDNEDDAFLIAARFRQAGYRLASSRVDTRATVERALADDTWDLVISDHAGSSSSDARSSARAPAKRRRSLIGAATACLPARDGSIAVRGRTSCHAKTPRSALSRAGRRRFFTGLTP
jgi:hypothetical protein